MKNFNTTCTTKGSFQLIIGGLKYFPTIVSKQTSTKAPKNWFQTSPPHLTGEQTLTQPNAIFNYWGLKCFPTIVSNQISTRAPKNWFQTSPPTLTYRKTHTREQTLTQPKVLFKYWGLKCFPTIVSNQISTRAPKNWFQTSLPTLTCMKIHIDETLLRNIHNQRLFHIEVWSVFPSLSGSKHPLRDKAHAVMKNKLGLLRGKAPLACWGRGLKWLNPIRPILF